MLSPMSAATSTTAQRQTTIFDGSLAIGVGIPIRVHVLFFAVGMMCTLAVVAEPALGSPLDEFGCMASAACAQRCGVRCVSECCRDQSCLETTNPAQWVFPVEFGLRCYERCYDDCGHEWEDFESCPGKCELGCEEQCHVQGRTRNPAGGGVRETPPAEGGLRCYTGCYHACAERGQCATCYDGCDQTCIAQCDAAGLDVFADDHGLGNSDLGADGGEGTCSERGSSAGGDCYDACYDTCSSREQCDAKAHAASSRWYEYVTSTGKVELMEAPPLSSQQHCQDECAYGCEDDCGHYDADGRFIERRPGCYQTCYSDCTQRGSCTDADLVREGVPLYDDAYGDVNFTASGADDKYDDDADYGGYLFH